MKIVNLARRPFLNAKPVVRLAALLWVLGAGLLAYNVWLYTRYLTGSASARGQLAEVSEQITLEEERLDRAEERLDRLDLYEQNSKALYLNRLISQRTFPWSQLFDDLEDILPRKVRLLNLSPSVNVEKAPRRRRRKGSAVQVFELPKEWISFQFNAVAGSEEDMYAFYDNLSTSEVFQRPVLTNESFDAKKQEIRFNLHATYLPDRPEPLPDEADDGVLHAADDMLEGEAGEAEATGMVAEGGVGRVPRRGDSLGAGGSGLDDSGLAGAVAQGSRPFAEGSRTSGTAGSRTASPATRPGRETQQGLRSANADGEPTGTAGSGRSSDGRTDTGRTGAGRAGGVGQTVIAGTPLTPQAVASPSTQPSGGEGASEGSTPPAAQPSPEGAGQGPGPAETRPTQEPRPAEPGRTASSTPRLQQGGG
jgi:Tfp pilus assembly protein PilN